MRILFTNTASVATVLTLIATLLLPLLVGLVTKASTRSAWKAILLLLLSAVTAFVSNLAAVKGTTDIWPLVQDAIFTFVVAVAVHYGFWKPTTVTAVVQGSLVKDSVALAA